MRYKLWVKRLAVLGGLAVIALVLIRPRASSLAQAVTWQRQASPGRLFAAHAFLGNNCAACHTAVEGPVPAKCIACHANNESLLQRQPTAFHAQISSCRECHWEHRGIERRPTDMDHAALTRIGLRQLDPSSPDGKLLRSRLITRIDRNRSVDGLPPRDAQVAAYEEVLNCTTCHANQDRHVGLFGPDCIQCHNTTKWTIPQFRHPSPRSTDCAQCHQAPPSHYMEHFRMISMTVARQPRARVDQCFLCHQTTSWNDIKRVGWYKHH